MLSGDAIAELNEKIRKVEQNLSTLASSRRTLKNATSSLDARIKEGMRIVGEIDIMLSNLFQGEAAKEAPFWMAAKQMRKVTRRKRTEKEEPETAPEPEQAAGAAAGSSS